MIGSYELVDSGAFYKLEQVGPFLLKRPSPQAVWQPSLPESEWQKADARFERHASGKGQWHIQNKKIQNPWQIEHGGVRFELKLTDFGHLGIFPEQYQNWDSIRQMVQSLSQAVDEVRVLNLFAYTGGSTLAAAQGGAHVVHVDASKTSVAWARTNAERNDLAEHPIRWIVDDVRKFVAREVRRGNLYHGVILDPPSYGRGNKGEVWNIEEHLWDLMKDLCSILDPKNHFVMLSSHSPGYTPLAMENYLKSLLPGEGERSSHEMIVAESRSDRVLPSGASTLLKKI